MELSFVIAALRRRLWLIAILMVLGLVGAMAATSSRKPQYEAAAELLVLPRASASGVASTSDPDRFIASEVATLKGSAFAERVVVLVPGTSRSMLASVTTIEQQARTDVVAIKVLTEDPQLSQDIANAYAQLYIEGSTARDNQSFAAELAEIQEQIDELSERIEAIERQRSTIPLVNPNAQERALEGQLVAQSTLAQGTYNQLLATQASLRYSSQLKTRSEILQLASLPTEAIAPRTLMYAAAGLFLGGVLGTVAAVAWANASRRLLDTVQLSEVVGAQVVGTVPKAKRLAKDPRVAFEDLPASASAVIDQLCVRAEASAQGETDALTVAVVGSQRGAGATTVALAMAGRFARNGARTVMIDGDLADPQISRSFNALDDAGIPGLLARLAAARNEPLPPGAPQPVPPEALPKRVFTPTGVPDVRVLGVGAPTKARSLHRTNADVVIEAAARGGVDVVVIDGGPLLDAASTVRLCQVVDVVVLVVPVNRQSLEPLGVISRLLGYRSGDLLPVGTKLKPKGGARPRPQTTTDTGGDVDDIIEKATRWGVGEARVPRRPQGPRTAWPTPPGVAVGSTGMADDREDVPVPPVASPRLGAPPPRRATGVLPDDFTSDDDDEWVARRDES